MKLIRKKPSKKTSTPYDDLKSTINELDKQLKEKENLQNKIDSIIYEEIFINANKKMYQLLNSFSDIKAFNHYFGSTNEKFFRLDLVDKDGSIHTLEPVGLSRGMSDKLPLVLTQQTFCSIIRIRLFFFRRQFKQAYEQMMAVLADRAYIPTPEDYLIKILCEIQLNEKKKAHDTLIFINDKYALNKKMREFGLILDK